MKMLIPLIIALLGLGAGVGAGLALKPAPEPPAEAAADCDPDAEAANCPPMAEADPFEPAPADVDKPEGELAYVPLDKPFVVPVFAGEKVIAMVVVSLSVEVGVDAETGIKALQPRLRDKFLKVMFRHANSGGFDGSFTTGQKMDDLKAALLAAAREVVSEAPVGEILITEIARQDV